MDWGRFTAELSERTEVRHADAVGPELHGICCDSRKAGPGNLFCALPGARDDGARYIAEAAARGAVAVLRQASGGVADPAPALPEGIADIRAADARGAMATAAAILNGDPTRELDLLGVTGTNGKTTVTFMIRHLLESSGQPCALVGTVRYEWAGKSVPADRTTPEATDLQLFFAEALAAGQRTAVMEVSSQGLCARRLEGLRFAAAVFTNLTPEHLDYHRDMESYFAAKHLLFEALAGGCAAGPAIVNADDPYGRRLAEDPLLAGRTLLYSLDGAADADVRAERIRCAPDKTSFRLLTPWGSAAVRLPLIGRYNVANALAAAAAAGVRGVTPDGIADALGKMPGVPGRLERVPDPSGGRHVFVDYAHTPDALENVLRTLRELVEPPARLLCVFGCGGDRDATKRPVMGRIASELADGVILTSDNPRNEDPAAILREIRAGMDVHPPLLVEPDRPTAVRETLHLARPGDIVVVAGKGHENYQEGPGGRRSPMDDRLLIRAGL